MSSEYKFTVDPKVREFLKDMPPLSPEEQERLKSVAADARRVFDEMHQFQRGYMEIRAPRYYEEVPRKRLEFSEDGYVDELSRAGRGFPEHVFSSDEERQRVVGELKHRGILP